MRQLYLDLDGVIADFNGGYLREFGIKVHHDLPEPPDFWKRIDDHGTFFLDLPVMHDAYDLWDAAKRCHPSPIILTGIPRNPIVETQKRQWVAREFGSDIKVICCPSRDKALHGKPGDVLVDDWTKYRDIWERMGGIFILHHGAHESWEQMAAIFGRDFL